MLQAAHIGLDGLGLCDRNSVAGVVRAHLIKREKKLALPITRARGSSLPTVRRTSSPIRATAPAWGRLCRLLTRGNLRAEKGECILYLDDLLDHIDGSRADRDGALDMGASDASAVAQGRHHRTARSHRIGAGRACADLPSIPARTGGGTASYHRHSPLPAPPPGGGATSKWRGKGKTPAG